MKRRKPKVIRDYADWVRSCEDMDRGELVRLGWQYRQAADGDPAPPDGCSPEQARALASRLGAADPMRGEPAPNRMTWGPGHIEYTRQGRRGAGDYVPKGRRPGGTRDG